MVDGDGIGAPVEAWDNQQGLDLRREVEATRPRQHIEGLLADMVTREHADAALIVPDGEREHAL